MACSIKGNVKENISPSTGAGKHFLGFQPPLTIEDAGLVLCPSDLGAYVVPSQQMHLLQ
jgi:hypothetical protein